MTMTDDNDSAISCSMFQNISQMNPMLVSTDRTLSSDPE